MLFTEDYFPQFRESEENGQIGVQGYFCYFQDMATQFMHQIQRGNDVLPTRYGVSWIYTKYKLQVLRAADFTAPLHLETWIEPGNSRLRIRQDLEISRDGILFAQGRLESCLFDFVTKKPCPLTRIAFPENLALDRHISVGPFQRAFPQPDSSWKSAYTHTVRYTDLDKSHHVNNLRYVRFLLDAFPSCFYQEQSVSSLEIHYNSQCREGDQITIRQKSADGGIFLAGTAPDGTTAVIARMETKPEAL